MRPKRIGIIVEGQSEFESLPVVWKRLVDTCEFEFRQVKNPDIQPSGPIGKNIRQCLKSIRALSVFKPSLVVILLDRDSDERCPGQISAELAQALERESEHQICVVIKNRCFENWLIANLAAVQRVNGFTVSNSIIRRIGVNNADNVDAARTLSECCQSRSGYQKVKDSRRILEAASVDRIASNSRSFRRLLRCLGHPAYISNSRHP